MQRNNALLTLSVFTICLLTVSSTASADGIRDAIVYPTTQTPVTVGADHILEIRVALRLPLTPPPGVQQEAAIKDWQLVLTRRDTLTLEGTAATLSYTLKVMRIRPVEGDTYRIQAELPPWLPEGRYTLAVQGPGFDAEVSNAVSIAPAGGPTDGAHTSAAMVTMRSPMEIVLTNTSNKSQRNRLLIYLAKDENGVTLQFQGKPVHPSAAAFATLPPNGARVLSFDLDLPPSDNGNTVVQLIRSAEKTQCDGIIQLEESAANDPIAYRTLRLATKRAPMSAIWDFGDGRFGVGNPVRHRFLLTNEATVSVHAIDEGGRLCSHSTRAALNRLSETSGCACTAIGH